MTRRPPRSTLFPTRRSSDLRLRSQIAASLTDRLNELLSTARDALGMDQPRVHVAQERLDVALEELRSEEHTSELQSPMYLVCRLLLEKKKKITYPMPTEARN